MIKYILSLALLLSGCAGSSVRNAVSSIPTISPPDAATPFEAVAYWGSGVAGLLFIAGVIMLWVNAKRGQQLLVIALSMIVGCQIMLWVGAHLLVISVIILVGGLVHVAYVHRENIEDLFEDEERRHKSEQFAKAKTEVITREHRALDEDIAHG